MEQVRDEIARLVRQEAALKLIIDDGLTHDSAEQARLVLLAVQARIIYLRNTLLVEVGTESVA